MSTHFWHESLHKISDGLRLCKEDDVELARDIIELLVKRNHIEWNHTNSI